MLKKGFDNRRDPRRPELLTRIRCYDCEGREHMPVIPVSAVRRPAIPIPKPHRR